MGHPRSGLWALVWALLMAGLVPAGRAAETWQEVLPGVLRSSGLPTGYALTDGGVAVLIGAPRGAALAALKARGFTPELALLTHHHRDSCERAGEWVQGGLPVRAGKMTAAWLSPTAVAEFWEKSMPRSVPGQWPPLLDRFWGHWNYFVHPTGVAGVRFDLEADEVIAWRGWRIEVVATPGHSRDHLAFIARRAEGVKDIVSFCGDALAAPGKMWAPFTMDWHHANPDGQQAAADSLRRLADARPTWLCPEHGEAFGTGVREALLTTAARLDDLARLKTFERYSKETLGNAPATPFLAPTQVGTANPQGNPQPWTRLSPHLYLTGNTYALASKDGPVLLADAYSLNLTQRVAELRRDFGVGPVEVVTISHAHNDHYTGVFALPDRASFQVWALDRIADVVSEPGRFRAPYVDARAVKVDRRLRDGEVVRWREYELKFHHHPGQTRFGMGLEVTVDGKRCVFTGDNFYHVDQYTGTGGWSALNRGMPPGHARTARAILAAKPDWILAEHGGAFAFNAEDFQRRARWADAAAEAADAISSSGDHAWDWDLHRVRVQPHLVEVAAGRRSEATLVLTNPSLKVRHFNVRLMRAGIVEPMQVEVTVPPARERRHPLGLSLVAGAPPGRHIVAGEVQVDGVPDAVDVFFVVVVPSGTGIPAVGTVQPNSK